MLFSALHLLLTLSPSSDCERYPIYPIMPRFKLVFFSPTKDTTRILNHIFSKYPNNAGKIGEYEHCAFVTRGTGQFRPGPEANPHIGKPGELEFVEEDRVETLIVDKGESEEVKGVIKELKSVCYVSRLLIPLNGVMNVRIHRCIRMKRSHMMSINSKIYENYEMHPSLPAVNRD